MTINDLGAVPLELALREPEEEMAFGSHWRPPMHLGGWPDPLTIESCAVRDRTNVSTDRRWYQIANAGAIAGCARLVASCRHGGRLALRNPADQ
jgi:hypothetical protein